MPEAAATTTPPTVTGKLVEQTDEKIVITIPGFDYRLHLVPTSPVTPMHTGRVTGVVRAKAKRIDVIPAGGRYVDPVYGRPRRVQGRITGGDAAKNEIYVCAGPTLVITPMAPQTAADFMKGQMVSFGVEAGATFTPSE